MSTNTAWVTLATNDSYCLGALVLAHSLKRVNTVHQLAVLITPGVSQPMRQQLNSVFNVVKEVDVMNSGDEANLALMARPDLGVTFTKLHCWNLTQFSKCVFLDADVLVLQNCDELFEREELSAAPDVGWPDCFNSGVFVFVPSKDTFKALLDCALAQGSFDGGDQGLLNMFFGDWASKDIKKHLPFIYNMVSSATYSYLPAFKLFGSQVKIVHFLGVNKPWLQGSSGTSPTMSGYLDAWWNIFRSQVSQSLTTDMNCTFDGVRWPNHPSSMPSPFPVHQHPYDHFRDLEQQQLQQQHQQQHVQERHVFIDPWENLTVDQVQTPQNITYSLGRIHDRIESESETPENLVHKGSSEVHLRENLNQVVAEQSHIQRSYPNDRRDHVPQVKAAQTPPPPPHTQYLTEHLTAVKQNIAPPQVNQIDYHMNNNSNQTINCFFSETSSNRTDNHVHSNNNQISSENSSSFNQFHQPPVNHILPSSTLSADIPSSSRKAVAMHSNNHSQICSLQQQDTPSNGDIHQEAGLAGALAGGERSAFEEVWRRQNWEQGVIDYMGRDSFDNIWRKISESAGIAPASSTAVPPAPPTPVPGPQPSESKPGEITQDKSQIPAAQAEPVVAAAVAAPLQSEPPKPEAGDKAEEPKAAAAPETPKTEEVPVPPTTPAAEPSPTDKQTTVEPSAPKGSEDKEKKTEVSAAEVPKSETSSKKEGESPKEEIPPPPPPATAADSTSPAADAEASKVKTQEVPKSEVAPPQTAECPEKTPQKEQVSPKSDVPKETSAPAVSEADKAKEGSAEVKQPTQTEGGKDSSAVVKETEQKACTEDKSQQESAKPSQDTSKSEVSAPIAAETQKTDSPSVPLPEPPKAEVPKPDSSAEAPKTDSPAEAPKEDAPAAAPKPDIPADAPKAEVPSAEVKEDKSIPPQKGEQKADKAKETALPEAPKVEESKPLAPATEAVAEKASAKPVAESPKDDSASKKQTDLAVKPTAETQKEPSSPATAPIAEPTVATAVASKDSAPAAGGAASDPLSTIMPSSPGMSGTPELPSEGAATPTKPSSEPKKAGTPSSPPQTPTAEGTSAEKSVAAPVPPKRKGNKEQKSQNGGKQSKSKK